MSQIDIGNPGDEDAALSAAITALHIGGFRQVADLSARDAIPSARRAAGMVVAVVATGREYKLVGGVANGNWVDVTPAIDRAAVKRARYGGLSIVSGSKQSLAGPNKSSVATGTYDTSRVRHDNLTGKPVSALALAFANYGPSGGTEAPNANAVTILAAIEKKSATSDITQDMPRVSLMTPSGANTIYSGISLDRAGVIITQPLPFDVEAGGTVFERTGVTPATSTGNFPRGGCMYGSAVGTGWGRNNGEGAAANSNWVADGNSVSGNITPYYYSASALLGALSDGSIATSVALIGDSIQTGTDDAGYGGPYVGGPGQRLFEATPRILLPIPGEKLADIVQPTGFTTKYYARAKLLRLSTHVVSNYGRNDVEQAQTLAQYKANLLALAKICMARGQHFAQMTILPSPLSTDGWFTTGNQTQQDATKDALRNSINAWLRDTSAAGFVAQANAQVAAGYVYPGAAAVLDICAPIECNAAGALTAGGNLILGAQSAVVANGTATAGTSTSVTLSSASWTVNAFQGYGLYIASGTGAGQMRGIAYNSATVLTTNNSFSTTPDATSVFQVYKALGMNGVHPLSTMFEIIANDTGVKAARDAFLALE